jgi:signal transduction histidine kinase/CheY-like chemotaxis protein
VSDIFVQDVRVRAELIKVLYARGRPVVYTNVAAALLAAFFFRQHAETGWLLVWLAPLVPLTIVRLMLIARYERAKPSVDAAARWGFYYAVTTAASGFFWCIGVIVVLMFVPSNPVLSLFIMTVFTGYVAGSVPVLAAHLAAFYAFIVPMLLSLTLAFLLRGDELHLILAVMVLIFLLLNLFFARSSHRTLAESIALRFKNIHLIEELEEKKSEAETANVAKSKFLAAASHDLRQPLHALTLFVSALSEQIHAPPVRTIVSNINVSVQALEKLFASLLDISRLDAGVIQPEVCDFQLQEMFARLQNDYAPAAWQKGLTFVCPVTDAVVRSDPQLLERILRNYLSNAIRYTNCGQIMLRCQESAEAWRVDVTDTGSGIPSGKLREIFREFHQLENPERDRSKGLGLGLAIVERLSKLMQHPIAVESEPGKGSVFTIYVPIGDRAAIAVAHPSQTQVGPLDLTDLVVLVIDDEADIREGMKTLLGQWGCRLFLAGSEEEAIESLRQVEYSPDVIIADYRLREDRTGAQAIKRIQEIYGNTIPSLIITGDTAPDRLREALASGHHLLHKPVAPAQLRAFLANAKKNRTATSSEAGS